jgi:hypothetical protein
MFFLHPDDLTNLDIANGQCYNQSIAQNLTFGWQGLPLGLGKTPSAVNASANHTGAASGFSNREAAGAQSLLALVAAMFAATFMFL